MAAPAAATASMRIIVVGAGFAGLSLAIVLAQADHQVTLIEAAEALAEVGAGVQMTPQAVKYLFAWGLRDDLLAEALAPREILVRDAQDGALLGTLPVAAMEEQYGAPYIVVHRAALLAVLERHAVAAGARIRLASRVARYDFAEAAVELTDGARLEADLVVAADGINSLARAQLLGADDLGSQPTGWAAFRMTVDVSALQGDSLTADLVDLTAGSSNFWIAPHTSVMTYLVKRSTVLNMALSHRDDVDTRGFTPADYARVIRETYGGYEPRVQRMLELSRDCTTNYPVYAVPPLRRWTHDSGRFTLVGDAAHAMAFYMSMGVSLAVEDAAALAAALDAACGDGGDGEALRRALCSFEEVRKARAAAVQRASLHGGDSLHVADGEERAFLYEALGHAHEARVWPPPGRESPFVRRGEGGERLGPGGFTDKGTRDWCYGYDAIAPVVEAYRLAVRGGGSALGM